jgi:hypothetical protein
MKQYNFPHFSVTLPLFEKFSDTVPWKMQFIALKLSLHASPCAHIFALLAAAAVLEKLFGWEKE